MFKIVTATCLLTASFAAIAWVQATPSLAGSPPTVDSTVVEGADKYLRAVLVGDASAVAGMFREDATLMPSDCPLLRGRLAIQQYYSEWFKSPEKITAFTFTHLESPILGDTAFDVGTYNQTLSITGVGPVNIAGKYSVILKRSGGEWKIAYLIFNTDSPSKMPSAASGTR